MIHRSCLARLRPFDAVPGGLPEDRIYDNFIVVTETAIRIMGMIKHSD